MTPLDIRIKLLRKGKTYADIARECGCHRELVRYSVERQPRYKNTSMIRIQRFIGNLLEKDPNKIWPAHKPKRKNHYRKAA